MRGSDIQTGERSPADPKAARAALEDTIFAANRLRILRPRLQKHYERVARAERKTAWIEQFDAIKLEHYTLVAELKETYGELVTQDGRPSVHSAHSMPAPSGLSVTWTS